MYSSFSNVSVSGHRKQSFICLDDNELVELRASQRTYNGAYGRTALGILGYALTVLRLFGRPFYRGMSAPPPPPFSLLDHACVS